ncbi:MAG: MerR family transcriptional regulator [Raoultibacter sp.]
MFYIGSFSKMGKTTVKTLHYYDRIGLLRPEAVDRSTGYRLYTTRQLVELHRIQSLRQAGLSIEEITEIAQGADVRLVLEHRREEIDRELREREDQRARISFILSKEKKEFFMSYQTTIKEIPSCIVYTKQLTVPDYNAYFEVIPAIGRAVKAANPTLTCAIPEYCFISYLDEEYKEKDINFEYNEAVTEFGVDVDGIYFREIPAVTVASVMHRGSYVDLPQAYAFAMDWVEKNGYRIADTARESYIDGVWNCTDEANWLTEIQIPIEK